ncbi:MAG: hypothetical protein K5770_07245 [Lachnospiraceae bacterium]|nr:hypothetical protein [Lachnospiraceae bacterium]
MELVGGLRDSVSKVKSKKEAKRLIENAGMKLTDDELNMVAGGIGSGENPATGDENTGEEEGPGKFFFPF